MDPATYRVLVYLTLVGTVYVLAAGVLINCMSIAASELEGGSAPRVRFWSRPEVTVIDIVSTLSSN